MPAAVALAGAAFSASAGMAAIGAAGAGLTAAGVLGGMMVAGGALTALGTVSGNKKLAKIGGALSLVGGVGQLATGVINSVSGAGSNLAGSATDTIGQSVAGTDAFSLANDAAATSGSIAESLGKTAAPKGLLESIMQTPVGQEASAWGAKAKQGVEALSSWAKANPQTAQLASGIVQGAAGAYAQPKAASAAAREQQRLQDLVRQRYSDSVRNLVIPSLSKPVPPTVQPIGLINGIGG